MMDDTDYDDTNDNEPDIVEEDNQEEEAQDIEIIEEEEPNNEEREPEEEHHDRQEESQDENSEEEEEFRAPKKRDKSKTRINQIQREKYRALHELDQMKSENDQLRQMVDLSSQASTRQQEENIVRRLERAEHMKLEAIESGDAKAQIDADREMSLSLNEMQTLNNWKAQKQVQDQYQNQRPQDPAYIANAPVLNDWVQRNQWFHPESDSYDEEMSDHIQEYSVALNRELSRQGYDQQIMSPEYFAEIEKEAKGFMDNRNSQNPNRRNLNMRTTKGGASPSRGGYSSAPQQKQLKISGAEKETARRMGVSDKEYLSYREAENRNQRGRR